MLGRTNLISIISPKIYSNSRGKVHTGVQEDDHKESLTTQQMVENYVILHKMKNKQISAAERLKRYAIEKAKQLKEGDSFTLRNYGDAKFKEFAKQHPEGFVTSVAFDF